MLRCILYDIAINLIPERAFVPSSFLSLSPILYLAVQVALSAGGRDGITKRGIRKRKMDKLTT